ncbi:MAG: MFS transporter, partial [Glutamicibacter sp.]
MFLSATADSMASLAIWRIVTGLGVGGILACTNVITSEYSNGRWRGMAVSIYTAGYGVGATLGGMAAVSLQAHYGWRSVFIFGGVLTMVAFLALLAVVPESVDFLLTRRTARTAEKLSKLARKMHLGAENVALPEQGSSASGRSRHAVLALFSPDTRRVTAVIWVAFFAVMFGFYFVM